MKPLNILGTADSSPPASILPAINATEVDRLLGGLTAATDGELAILIAQLRRDNRSSDIATVQAEWARRGNNEVDKL